MTLALFIAALTAIVTSVLPCALADASAQRGDRELPGESPSRDGGTSQDFTASLVAAWRSSRILCMAMPEGSASLSVLAIGFGATSLLPAGSILLPWLRDSPVDTGRSEEIEAGVEG